MHSETFTPYPELNTVLCLLATRLQETLNGELVGAYLHGSFAVGDFDRESDVDFLVVVENELSEPQVAALQTLHAQLFAEKSKWAQHLDGSYFPRGILNAPESVGAQPLWYLDNGSRALIRSDHDNQWVVRWVVREHGIVLVGPPPSSLFSPVPPQALRNEVWKTMREWGQTLQDDPEKMNNRWYQPFVVLSYCRMLQTLQTGTIRSKRDGARWGRENLAQRWSGLIQHAENERPNADQRVRQLADPDDLRETGAFIAFAIAESNRW